LFNSYLHCAIACASKGPLDYCGGSSTLLRVLEELGGRKEDAFSFGRQCSLSNVHVQSKPAKVVVYQVHSSLQVASRAKWECTIIDI
jgi:hypothetical protein